MRHWFINHLAAYRLSGLTAPAYVVAAAKEWGRANKWPLIFFVGPLVLLSFCSGKAIGAEPTGAALTWQAPTTYTDGSALSKCASQTSTGDCLKGFRVYRGGSAASLVMVQDINDRNATSYTFSNLPKGTHFFAVTAYSGTGVESALSNVGSKIISGTPSAPVLTVAGTTAYRMRQSVDGFEMVALGTVPLGTQCRADLQVGEFHAIPRDAVTLASPFDTKPLLTFARCSAG